MKHFTAVVFLAALILLAAAPLGAQDKTPPLLAMLALVPDTPQTYEGIPVVSYADYRAFETSRGIPTPSVQDFLDKTETWALWVAATAGLNSGPQFVQYALRDMERTRVVMGFSFFDIDRALTFGFPRMATALAGDFDPERIAAAYSSRGFTQTEMDGATVWCAPKGCDSGLDVDIAGREPADLFGGLLGRKEPLALLPNDYVLNSPDIAVVQQMIAAQQGTQSSLAENLFYLAAAEAVSANGVLRQAQIYKWSDLGMVSGSGLPADVMEQVKEFAAVTDPLPAYALAVIADIWDEAEDLQIALIGLVYSDQETADTAATVLGARVEKFVSLDRPLTERLEELEATTLEPYLYHSEAAQKWVAVLAFRYPSPSNEPRSRFPRYQPSSRVFRYVITTIYNPGFFLVGTEFTVP